MYIYAIQCQPSAESVSKVSLLSTWPQQQAFFLKNVHRFPSVSSLLWRCHKVIRLFRLFLFCFCAHAPFYSSVHMYVCVVEEAP